MGVAMARNLIKAGYDVTVWNRSADKCRPLVELGAKMAASPKAVAEGCDVTFTMVSDPDAALEVALGKDGIVHGIGKGKGYVDVSTVDGGCSKQISDGIRATGALFLEAPVSGSKGPAENGQLIFLCAGDKALFDAVAHPLGVMGKASFHLGETGKGAEMKLVVNMVMGSMMEAFCEGLALADKAGLRQEDVLQVLDLGAMACPMFKLKGPTIIKREYPVNFPLKHQQKDMRLALALGDDLDVSLPVAAAANEAYKRAKALGQEDEDFAAVYESTQNFI